MERLTKKCRDGNYCLVSKDLSNSKIRLSLLERIHNNRTMAFNKLGKIEDLEEEMGIDVVEFLTHYKKTGVIKW